MILPLEQVAQIIADALPETVARHAELRSVLVAKAYQAAMRVAQPRS